MNLKLSVMYFRGFVLLTLALTYIIDSIFPVSLFGLLVALVILAFIVSWPGMAPFPRIMSIVLFLLGNILFFQFDGNSLDWTEAILDNVGLVSLFIAVPLLSYPLRNGGYIEYMNDFVRSFIKKDIKAIGFVTALTCLTSSFLNLGSVRVIYELFADRFKHMNKTFAKCIIQGFSLAAFWSPYFAGVAIILHLVGVSFISFMVYGLVMMIVSFSGSMLVSIFSIKKNTKKGSHQYLAAGSVDNDPVTKTARVGNRKGIELLVVLIGLFFSLFLLEKWFHYEVLLLISFVAFTYPIIWSVLIRRFKQFIHSIKDYTLEVVPNVHNESIMIISATFFSQMIQLTSFPSFLSEIFVNITQLSVIFTVLVIIVTSVASAIFIHQILPVSVYATTLTPDVIGLSPELFALTLVVSWGLVPLLSPVSAANLLVGSLFKTKTFEIGIWNIKYALVVILLSSVSISIMNLF